MNRLSKGTILAGGIRTSASNVISGSELEVLDGVSAGTVTASKALVVDSNKDLGDLRNLDAVNVDAGASGTAGSVDVFPATASKGKLAITAADSTGNTTTTIVNAEQAGARTYTIPDAGASASFLMTEGAQTKNANLTLATGADLLFSGTTGQNEISVIDNLADALSIKIASGNDFLVLDSTDNAEEFEIMARATTTDGVSSGTARVIGGRAYSNVAAADNVTAVASNNSHVDFANTYSIPASTLKAGSLTKIRAMIRVTDASGTDTLETKLYIGGTTLLTSTAFDPDAAGDFALLEFDLVSRAAPGAAVEHVGFGRWTTLDGSSLARAEVILAPTNLATNGALIVKASAKWSSNTASTSARLEILNVEIA